MRKSILLLCVFAAPLVSAQNTDWRVLHASPSIGSVGGGDLVEIRTTYRETMPCDPFPCGRYPDVFFGNVKARFAEQQEGVIRVITPEHPPGSVTVSVTIMGVRKVLTGEFTFRDAREMPVQSNYDTVLFPVAVSGEPLPGDRGSLWTSEIWAANRGSHRVEFFVGIPETCTGADCIGKPYPAIAPGETVRLELPTDNVNAAYRGYLQKGGAENVTFSLRIRDVSGSDDNHGTEIPVPRPTDFSHEPVTVLNVPIDGRSRAALRIYSVAGHVAEVPVSVDVYPVAGGEKVASKQVILRNPGGFGSGMQRFRFLEYAFISDLRREFPELPEGAYRLEIADADPTLIHGLYALVSVTNNRTQLVTAIGSR